MSGQARPTYSLAPMRYLELIRGDADLLADTAAGLDLDAPVPTCPGWTVRDAVLHTAEVYQHKVACTRDGVKPDPWPPEISPAALADPVAFFRQTEAELLAELGSRDPASPSATWWPADQTVGFWCRRMAQETAIHRADVQSVSGVITPIDNELAVDGVDEVLELMLAGDWSDVTLEEWGDVDPQAGADRPIDLASGDRRWRIVMYPDRNDVSGVLGAPIAGSAADTTVTGEPSDLLLWAWGRLPESVVSIDGDRGLVNALRDRLVLATQ